MYICTKCNNLTENKMNFCALCGAPVVEAVPVSEPEYPPVAPQQPAVDAALQQPLQPEAPAPVSKGNVVTSRLGFVFAVIGAVIALCGIYAVWSGFWEGYATDYFADLPTNSMISFFLCAPLSLMGFIFSSEAEKVGVSSTFSRTGKILSVAGLVVSVLLLILAFVSCVFVYA